MKRVSFVLGILLIAASLFALTVFAAGETATTQTNAGSTVVYRGDEIEFTVSVDTPITVTSGSVSLVSEDGILFFYPNKDIELISGECNVSNALMSEFDIDGKRGGFEFAEPTVISGVLFTVRFKVLNDATIGDSKVKLSVQLNDAEGDPINVSNNYAEFTVGCQHKFDSIVEDSEYLKSPADCTNKAVYYFVCSYCEAKGEKTYERGDVLGHLWSESYTCISEGHYRTCTRDGCGEDEALEAHDGGVATCTERAVCDICKNAYGNTLPHDFDDGAWKSDGSMHWQECECGDRSGQSEHSYDYDCDTDCNVCGYHRTAGHSYTFPNHNNSEHWYECECGDKDPDSIEEHVGGVATCTSKAICDECNNEYGDYLPHEYYDYWSNDASGHWHECSCGAKTDTAGHAYVSICDEYCKICGYERDVIHVYIVSGYDEYDHWIKCVCGAEKPGSREEHTGGEATCTSKAVCTVCNTPYGDYKPHEYGDDDLCDDCGYDKNDSEETTEPETTDPETTDSETTEPETDEPETTDPETTEPETTEPETTEPETTDPETDDPETTDPETTEPETTDPETTEPETTEPETTDPETTDPETTEPETTEPETTDPETDDPETTDPETTDPETTDPETDDPETTEPETDDPETDDPDDRITYIFKYYDEGELYAENEVHVLDAIMTVITNDAFFTEELRLYQSSKHSATAIFSSTKVIESISVNAGFRADELKVWGSSDGETWTLIDEISVSVKYADHEVDMNGEDYTFIKLESSDDQIRLISITVGYSDVEITPPETDDTETDDTETDDTETDDTETDDTETDDTETDDTETDDTETDDTETDDTESGDTESGDTETDDTESGDTESGDTETDENGTQSVDTNLGNYKDDLPRELISIIIVVSVVLLGGTLFWVAFGRDRRKF